MKISHVVAYSTNRVIGNGLEIPWRIKGEQARFKDLTTGKTIIMGRKTYESIGKALPNRRTIVISSQADLKIVGVKVVRSLADAFTLCYDEDEVFIVGGGQLYASTLQMADVIYATEIHKEFEGDVFYPEIPEDLFEKTFSIDVPAEIPFTYMTFTRKA